MKRYELRCSVLPGKYNAVNLAIVYYFIMVSIHASFSGLLPDIVMTIIQILFYALAINSIFCIGKSLNYKHVIFTILAVLVFIISFAFAKDDDVFGMVGSTLIKWCIPLFFLGASIRDIDDLYKGLKIASIIIIVITYLSVFVTKSSGSIVYAYSQNVGYHSIIPFVIFFSEFVLKKKASNLIGAFSAFLAVLMGGARGALLCIAIAYILIWICLGKFNEKSVIVSSVILLILLIFTVIFYQDILFALMYLFEKLGVSTRIITGLIEHNLANDTSRDILSKFALDYAKQHVFVGTGIINDRKLIYDNLTINTNKTVYGYYCHNFFLENLMQFGLVPGIMICAIWLKNIVSPLKRCNPENLRIIALVMCAVGFLPLLISYSYITYQYFFLLAGFVFSYKNILVFHNLKGQIYEE